MADTQGNGANYRVEFTGNAIAQVRLIAQRAIYQKRGREAARALRRAIRRLKAAPSAVGEPLYHLRQMKMHVYGTAFPPLYVQYGIHEERPIVIVRRVTAFTDPIN